MNISQRGRKKELSCCCCCYRQNHPYNRLGLVLIAEQTGQHREWQVEGKKIHFTLSLSPFLRRGKLLLRELLLPSVLFLLSSIWSLNSIPSETPANPMLNDDVNEYALG